MTATWACDRHACIMLPLVSNKHFENQKKSLKMHVGVAFCVYVQFSTRLNPHSAHTYTTNQSRANQLILVVYLGRCDGAKTKSHVNK